jgi:hypothetical protein
MHTISTQDTLECGPVHLVVANKAIQPLANSSSIQLQPHRQLNILYVKFTKNLDLSNKMNLYLIELGPRSASKIRISTKIQNPILIQ